MPTAWSYGSIPSIDASSLCQVDIKLASTPDLYVSSTKHKSPEVLFQNDNAEVQSQWGTHVSPSSRTLPPWLARSQTYSINQSSLST